MTVLFRYSTWRSVRCRNCGGGVFGSGVCVDCGADVEDAWHAAGVPENAPSPLAPPSSMLRWADDGGPVR